MISYARIIACFSLVLLLVAGCSSSKIVRKSDAELEAMENTADKGRNCFRNANYREAEKIIKPLCQERTVNQPLYQCELASVYLLAGEKEKAHQTLLATHRSLESLFDAESERRATSLWGNEVEKVYKGDPYERCTLYALLAMSFLERGDIGNALAAVKTGLLADSDTKKNAYKADYALLQLLGAKCYEIRKEYAMRDKMLNATFDSFMSNEQLSRKFAKELFLEYSQLKKNKALDKPPSELLCRVCIIPSEKKLEEWLRRALKQLHPSKSTVRDVAAWAKKHTAKLKPLNFNTLLVIWTGLPPHMLRIGEYGETRVIESGTLSYLNANSIFIDGTEYDPFGGFGDINFQALTRGGRLMDNVLKNKARTKKTTSNVGSALIAGGAITGGYVGLGMMAAGLTAKGIAYAMTAKADIRHWRNLPHTFAIIPLTLAPGEHIVEISRWRRVMPMANRQIKVSIAADSDCNIIHIKPSDLQAGAVEKVFGFTSDDDYINGFSSTAINSVDSNVDGELSAKERAAAKKKIIALYDLNKDGKLSAAEKLNMKFKNHLKFVKSMEKK